MNVISLLKPSEVEKLGGLSPKAICGAFEGDETDPEKFLVNKEFVTFMHDLIGKQGSNLSSLKDAAQRQKDGYLYIIDLRTPQGVMGDVPSEDIVGAFKVEKCKLVPNEYWPNKSHKIFSKSGLMKLPPELHDLIVDELKKGT